MPARRTTPPTPSSPPPHKNGYKISFTVAEDSETRTTLDGGDVLRWVQNDQVGIYTFGYSVNANNLTVAEVDQSPVVFSGDLQEPVSSGDMFYAYYPYDARQSSHHTAVKLSIPAEQTQTAAGVYNGESNPLVAVPMAIDREQSGNPVRIGSVRFRQLGAIVELQLSSSGEAIREEVIRSVTFESETALAGDFKFNLTTVTVDGELSIEGYKLTKVKTTLDAPAAIPATGDGAARIYLTIAPGTYAGKIVVETDAAQYTFTLADAMTFKRAVIKGLPADLAEAQRRALSDLPISFADDNVRDICLTNWDENEDGFLSYGEAAKVTELGEVFYDNRTITSFDELQYFTGLQSIGQEAFYGCTTLTSINIPNGVTTIGNEAFYNCLQLKSIELPNGVTAIGERAFEYCSNLTSINVPNEVTEIGIYAFSLCENLASITIPKGVTEIGEGVFSTCRNLTNIDIPEGVKMIGALAFFNCTSLTNIDIPEGVTTIGTTAFMDCRSLTSITIPKNVTSIGRSAFNGCSNLKSVYCKPTDPPTLGSEAFPTTTSMKIYVPAGSIDAYIAAEGWSTYSSKIVAEINEDDPISFADEKVGQICVAKWDTSGDEKLSYKEAKAVTNLGITFMDNKEITSFDEFRYFTGLQSIGENAFAGCSNLTSIIIPEKVTEIGGRAFEMCSSLASIELPTGVTTIKDNAFGSCERLTSINIPEEVTTIGNGAFFGCSSLASIELPDGVTTIESNAFKDCTSLTSVNIPEGVTAIESMTFNNCTHLTSITIPESVKTIGGSAFHGCAKLTSITIPKNVTSIGGSAFFDCSGLTSIYCKPAEPPTLGGQAFGWVSPPPTIYVPMGSVDAYKAGEGWSEYVSQIVADLNDPISFADPNVGQICVRKWDTNGDEKLSYKEAAAVTNLGEAFGGNTDITSLDELQYFTGLQSIGAYEFTDCENLRSITIPENVSSIAYNAFFGCSSLTTFSGKYASDDHRCLIKDGVLLAFARADRTEYTIPDGVTTIREYVFSSCINLERIKLPNGVTTIGEGAFNSCFGLTSINIPKGVTTIGRSAFSTCKSLASIELPDGLTTIGNYAFMECSKLTSVTIPKSVTAIGDSAFSSCSNLTSVYCKPTDPPTLGSNVFAGTNFGIAIYVPMSAYGDYNTATNWSSYSDRIGVDSN